MVFGYGNNGTAGLMIKTGRHHVLAFDAFQQLSFGINGAAFQDVTLNKASDRH